MKLELCSLVYDYGSRLAVDSVTFSVASGEVFGLLGANGAGKTTTLSCIGGLLKGWKGEILFDGERFHPERSSRARSAIGVVPQELAVYENLTGRENLGLFADLCRVPKKRSREIVDRMLAFSGLESRANDYVRTYSGGMKRRLNLASALVHEPSLVLLDEPTVGVDPQSRNHLFDSILELKKSGTSMIYTTHYMEEAQRLCDRIGIMHEGHLLVVGTAIELAVSIGKPHANLEEVFLHLTGRSLRDG